MRSLQRTRTLFICHCCGEVAPPRTPATELVLETRDRRYPERYRVRGERKERVDPGGEGTEIVRSAWVCARCAEAETKIGQG